MKKEELYNRLSEELRDFTILNFQYEDPFGWDYSYPMKQQKPKEQEKEEPYYAEKDKRLKNLLTTKEDQNTKREILSYTATCITAALTCIRFSTPESEAIKELMRIADVTVEEMDDFISDIPYETMSCFHDESLIPYAVLFYKVVWDALCEGSGIRCWSNSKKKKYANRKERPCLSRLFQFLKYSNEHHYFSFQSYLSATLSNGSKEELKKIKKNNIDQVIRKFEDSFIQIAALECKRQICLSELSKELERLKKEDQRIGNALERSFRQFVKSYKSQKMQIPLAKSDAQINKSILDALKTDSVPDVLDNTLPAEIVRQFHIYEKKYQKNCKLFHTYQKKLKQSFIIQINDITLQTSDLLESLDPYDIAEGMLLSLLNYDESYTVQVGDYLHYYIGQPLGIPSYNFGYPDLDDEDQWDDDTDMYYDNDLTEELFSANETVTYNDAEITDTDILNTIQLKSLIASYSDFHVDEGIYIRKSVISAFESLGFEKSKARELAVCVASLSYAQNQLNSSMFLYSTFYNDKTDNVPAVPQNDIDKLQKNLDQCITQKNDAIRRQKQCEIDNQKLRHANAELERENEQLQKTIAQLQNQLKMKPVTAQKEKVSANEEKKNPFPYETDKNIILFGGFDSFCRAITQMIPDVRCVPCSTHLDLNLFKNADLVFIQANRLSHSNYWTVISTLKKSNVPFYHLNPASPKRCALEMIKEIEELQNR